MTALCCNALSISLKNIIPGSLNGTAARSGTPPVISVIASLIVPPSRAS